MTAPGAGPGPGPGPGPEGWYRRLLDVEHRLMREVGEVEHILLDAVLPRLGRAADHGVLWAGVAGLTALSGPAGRRAALRGLAALSVASATTNVLAKRASRRSRPPVGLVPGHRVPRRTPITTSFPSGHAASAAAFTLTLAFEHPVVGVALLPVGAAVAASRVVVGVHYPSDVLAGVALGAGAAALVVRLSPPAGRAQ